MKMMKNVSKFFSKKKNQAILVVCVLVLIIIVVVLVEVNKNNKKKNNNNQNNNNGNNVNNVKNVNNNNKNNNGNNKNNNNKNKINGVDMNKLCDAMESYKERYVKDDTYDGEYDDYSREKCILTMGNLIKDDSRLNDATKQEYANVMIECLLESNNNQELSDCIDGKMNQIKVGQMAQNDTALDEPEDLINDGNNVNVNNGNNNSITFGGVNNSGNNKQLNKNRIRIGPQRDNLINNGNNNGNNNSIHFETVNHTSHNNENIDQLSKNMYRMEAQRESNNKAINKFLRNHPDN